MTGVLAGLTFPHLEYNPIPLLLPRAHDAEGREPQPSPETPGAAGGAPGGAAFGRKASQTYPLQNARASRDGLAIRSRQGSRTDLSQRFVTRVPRKHSGASRRSISSQEEMKTGQGSPRPSMQRMIGRAYSANSGPGKLSHGLSHFVPNKSARCALYFHAKEKIIAHADAASR
jgi:hypothetical protein